LTVAPAKSPLHFYDENQKQHVKSSGSSSGGNFNKIKLSSATMLIMPRSYISAASWSLYGTKTQLSAPPLPTPRYKNGALERRFRYFFNAVRSALHAARLAQHYWTNALKDAVDKYNATSQRQAFTSNDFRQQQSTAGLFPPLRANRLGHHHVAQSKTGATSCSNALLARA
jgi:hypothetical protein